MQISAILPLPVAVGKNPDIACLPVAGKPPVIRVVESMLGAVADPGRAVIAAAEPLIDRIRTMLASQRLPPVSVVTAADGRADCLAAAVGHLETANLPTSHVLVYDVAQPLTSASLRDRVIDGLRTGSIVLPALAVTDSVKAVDERGSVTATVDRSTLRTVQYPRGFAVQTLTRLLNGCTSEKFDELAEALRTAEPITVVDGDADAVRVELPRDAQFLEAITGIRRPDLHGR